jgi:NADPH-dependent glutamate synthase beta subunit-like oxidoreductase
MTRSLRVAVVGSGPSGIYAADALTSQTDIPVTVDVIDKLPVPYGLVRYGVAPDHLSIRSVRGTLEKVLDRPEVRFLGNVEVGHDISIDQLRQFYDAIVLTYGAASDRRLGIPGEDLPGSIAATDLVNWYCGHPTADREVIEAALGEEGAGGVDAILQLDLWDDHRPEAIGPDNLCERGTGRALPVVGIVRQVYRVVVVIPLLQH